MRPSSHPHGTSPPTVRLIAAADATPPAVFVPIDFWGFNYRLARAMKTRGVPVAY